MKRTPTGRISWIRMRKPLTREQIARKEGGEREGLDRSIYTIFGPPDKNLLEKLESLLLDEEEKNERKRRRDEIEDI